MILEEYLEMLVHLAFDYEVQMAKLDPGEAGYFTIPSLKTALKWAEEFLAVAGIEKPPKCGLCEDTGYVISTASEGIMCIECGAWEEKHSDA